MEGRKIIIIEDDPDHAELILDELKIGGVSKEVVLMKDGQEVIDYFQETVTKWTGNVQFIISLIILDLNLPKVCGMDIIEFIKNNPMYRSIPIVILSICADQATINRALEKGANDYITKPFYYDQFIENISVLKQYC